MCKWVGIRCAVTFAPDEKLHYKKFWGAKNQIILCIVLKRHGSATIKYKDIYDVPGITRTLLEMFVYRGASEIDIPLKRTLNIMRI